MTEPATYSEAELAQASAEWEADDAREAAAKAAKVRQSRRKTIMLTLCGVGGLVIVAGAMAFVAATHTPAPKPYDSECGAVGCGGVMPGPRISVPSPGAVIGMPTMGGVAGQQHRDYDPLVDATVLTDSPADAISKLAATFKPKAGKRYKVEVKVTQDE